MKKEQVKNLVAGKKEWLTQFRAIFSDPEAVTDYEAATLVIDDLLVEIECLKNPELTKISGKELDQECL